DSDIDGDAPLSVSGASVNAAQGSVSVNADGTLNFTPAANFSGAASISYTLSDGHGGSAIGTLTVNVGANTPPTGADATVTIAEDTSKTSTAADFGFADADAGQSLAAVRIDSLPGAGALTLNGVAVAAGQVVSASDIAGLVFTPAADASGNGYASFSFSVQDSAGAFDATPNAITINVTPVADPAQISGTISGATIEDTTLVAAGTLNVADPDTGEAAFIAQTNVAGAHGSFSINAAGGWSYTLNNADPAVQALGNAQTLPSEVFTVSTVDGSSQQITVSISGVNDAAVLSADVVNLTETNAVLTTGGTLTISDIDSSPTFVAQAATVGSYGTFAIDANGVWTYTASSAHNEFAAGTVHTDTFSVASADGTLTSVTVNIAGTDDAPVISSDSGSVIEDTQPSVNGTLNARDADNAGLAFVAGATLGNYGSLVLGANGAWTYTLDSRADALAQGEPA